MSLASLFICKEADYRISQCALLLFPSWFLASGLCLRSIIDAARFRGPLEVQFSVRFVIPSAASRSASSTFGGAPPCDITRAAPFFRFLLLNALRGDELRERSFPGGGPAGAHAGSRSAHASPLHPEPRRQRILRQQVRHLPSPAPWLRSGLRQLCSVLQPYSV
uniref:Transmembrane protein n=1 Tax=Steinernema glaseri TaxID=37863 RepID=A0A1I8APK3_9BILA